MKKIVIASIAALALSSTLMAEVPKKCNTCHGADGSKNTSLRNAKGIPNLLSKADMRASLEGYAAGTVNKYKMGALMKGQMRGVTPAQIDAIVETWGK